MKYARLTAAVLALLLVLTACGTKPEETIAQNSTEPDMPPVQSGTAIVLSDSGVQMDGKPVGTDSADSVYVANDIIYYESGKDFSYGEGTTEDAHDAQEAVRHTVVHIAQPGTYVLSGKLSKGQIAVDLGEGAEENPEAVVTLILGGVDITCTVAPAVIFYNVYECGSTENPSKDVDTSAAGANVVVADGTENTVNGSYVARIYKPDSVVLNEDGTAVEDAKKLHKYDGAFYSKMSMNIGGNTGSLNIHAENEGLDSEMHLTVNGGNIHIFSGNDGINTNEDGVSVTTVNGGTLSIQVTGETGEGDGIDSNGWLVINGGTVIAAACSNSADAGIDSDMGIHINGGTVIASGSMLDRIEDGGQTYAVFNFAQRQPGTDTISLKNQDGSTVMSHCPKNAYSILIYSSPELTEGSYALWSNGSQLEGQGGGMIGSPGMRPEGNERPDTQPPEGNPPFGELEPPEGFTPPDGQEPPEEEKTPQSPGRPQGGNWNPNGNTNMERTTEFKISNGANMFSGIAPVTQETI